MFTAIKFWNFYSKKKKRECPPQKNPGMLAPKKSWECLSQKMWECLAPQKTGNAHPKRPSNIRNKFGTSRIGHSWDFLIPGIPPFPQFPFPDSHTPRTPPDSHTPGIPILGFPPLLLRRSLPFHLPEPLQLRLARLHPRQQIPVILRIGERDTG